MLSIAAGVAADIRGCHSLHHLFPGTWRTWLRDDDVVTAGGVRGATRREREILAHVGARMSNADIAARLHLSVRTVENHVSALLRKFGVTDRRALAAFAEQGLSEPPRVVGLPEPLTSFIGRHEELGAIVKALSEARLVTVQGPGGVGKTRLTMEAARAATALFPAGGAFVDLVPVGDQYVLQAVAAALDVTERPRQSLADTLAEHLSDRRTLLVLDNCEHAIDAVAAFAQGLLAASPGTRILATSRERLGIHGERVIRLAPLPFDSDAEVLFRERAAETGVELAADDVHVSEICRRLDGMPLAIELAAARVAGLGTDGVLAALDDGLSLLSGGRGVDERHRSLRAVVDWSYRLLDASERALFRRLSVFAGAFGLDAVVAIVGGWDRGSAADVLGRLVDKSLVVRQAGNASEWRLPATVRAFAAEQLRLCDEESATRKRHLALFSVFAVQLQQRIGGQWREDFDHAADDFRSALANCAYVPDPVAHQLARALGRLTFARRFLMEAAQHYEDAAKLAPSDDDAVADLLDAAGIAHFVHFSADQAFRVLLAAADRASGNVRAVALARAVEIAARYPNDARIDGLETLLRDAVVAGDPNDPNVLASLAAARVWSAAPEKLMLDADLAAEADRTARATKDPVLISAGLDAIRTANTNAGHLREAHRLSTERYALMKAMDRDSPRAAVEIEDSYSLACTDAIAVGDLATAMAVAEAARQDDLVGSYPFLSGSKLILVHVLTGNFDEALDEAEQARQAWNRSVRPPAAWLSPALSAVALAHGLRGDLAESRSWRARADAIEGVGSDNRFRGLTFGVFVDVRLATHLWDPVASRSEAENLVSRAFTELPRGWYQTYAQAAAAELAVVAGLPDGEARLNAARPAAEENDWAAACLSRAAGRLYGDRDALVRAAEMWDRIGARFEHAETLRLLR